MDFRFNGKPEDIQGCLKDADGKALPDVLGPRTLDGVAYTNVRTEAGFTIPSGCSTTGPELSAALLGDWFDSQTAPVALTEWYNPEYNKDTAK